MTGEEFVKDRIELIGKSKPHMTYRVSLSLAFLVALLPTLVFLVLFPLGEIAAVLALDHRHASDFQHFVVVLAMVSLPVIAAFSFFLGVKRDSREDSGDGTDSHDG